MVLNAVQNKYETAGLWRPFTSYQIIASQRMSCGTRYGRRFHSMLRYPRNGFLLEACVSEQTRLPDFECVFGRRVLSESLTQMNDLYREREI